MLLRFARLSVYQEVSRNILLKYTKFKNVVKKFKPQINFHLPNFKFVNNQDLI